MRRIIRAFGIASVMFAVSGLAAQGGAPSRDRVEALLRADRLAEAAAMLDVLTESPAAPVDLLRARLDLLIALGDESAAVDVGRRLAARMSSGLERLALERLLRSMSAVTDVDVSGSPLDLLDRIQLLRERGATDELEPMLQALESQLPGDPSTAYLVGEYYGSDHVRYDADRAVAAFQSFLARFDALTAADREGDEWKRLDVLFRMLGSAEDDPARELRLRVFGYVLDLQAGKRLQLIVPTTARRMSDESETAEFQDLSERLALHRERREPSEVFQVLQQMQGLQPDNPSIQYFLGEVYSSPGGKVFDRAKAVEAFQRFLDMTSREALEESEGARGRYGSAAVAGDISRVLRGTGQSGLDAMRLEVQGFLARLRNGETLYLISPERIISTRLTAAKRELDAYRRITQQRLEDLRESRSDLQRESQSNRTSRALNLDTLRRHIAQLEQQVATRRNSEQQMETEIAAMEAVLRRR